jgi:hypothetical protein
MSIQAANCDIRTTYAEVSKRYFIPLSGGIGSCATSIIACSVRHLVFCQDLKSNTNFSTDVSASVPRYSGRQ